MIERASKEALLQTTTEHQTGRGSSLTVKEGRYVGMRCDRTEEGQHLVGQFLAGRSIAHFSGRSHHQVDALDALDLVTLSLHDRIEAAQSVEVLLVTTSRCNVGNSERDRFVQVRGDVIPDSFSTSTGGIFPAVIVVVQSAVVQVFNQVRKHAVKMSLKALC